MYFDNVHDQGNQNHLQLKRLRLYSLDLTEQRPNGVKWNRVKRSWHLIEHAPKATTSCWACSGQRSACLSRLALSWVAYCLGLAGHKAQYDHYLLPVDEVRSSRNPIHATNGLCTCLSLCCQGNHDTCSFVVPQIFRKCTNPFWHFILKVPRKWCQWITVNNGFSSDGRR